MSCLYDRCSHACSYCMAAAKGPAAAGGRPSALVSQAAGDMMIFLWLALFNAVLTLAILNRPAPHQHPIMSRWASLQRQATAVRSVLVRMRCWRGVPSCSSPNLPLSPQQRQQRRRAVAQVQLHASVVPTLLTAHDRSCWLAACPSKEVRSSAATRLRGSARPAPRAVQAGLGTRRRWRRAGSCCGGGCCTSTRSCWCSTSRRGCRCRAAQVGLAGLVPIRGRARGHNDMLPVNCARSSATAGVVEFVQHCNCAPGQLRTPGAWTAELCAGW